MKESEGGLRLQRCLQRVVKSNPAAFAKISRMQDALDNRSILLVVVIHNFDSLIAHIINLAVMFIKAAVRQVFEIGFRFRLPSERRAPPRNALRLDNSRRKSSAPRANRRCRLARQGPCLSICATV